MAQRGQIMCFNMRRYLLIISFIFSVGYSQTPAYQTFMIGPFAAFHGQHANYKWPLIVHVPVQEYPGEKFALVLDWHGIGEKSHNSSTIAGSTTANVTDLFSNGQPKHWRYTNSPYIGKKYAAPGRTDSIKFIYAAGQVFGGLDGNSGDMRIWPTYTYNSLLWLIASYGHLIDRSRVYLTGLSFGGGGVWSAMQWPEISELVAGFIALAPGYISSAGFTPSYNFKNIADWGGGIIAIHSINDSTTDSHSCGTPPCNGNGWNTTTNTQILYAGSWFSDRAIDSLKKYNYRCQITYWRRNTGGHNVWDDIWDPARSTTIRTLANGNTFSHNVPWQSLLLRHTNTGHTKYVLLNIPHVEFKEVLATTEKDLPIKQWTKPGESPYVFIVGSAVFAVLPNEKRKRKHTPKQITT